MNDFTIRNQIKDLVLQEDYGMVDIDQLMKDYHSDNESLVENIKIHINKRPKRKRKKKKNKRKYTQVEIPLDESQKLKTSHFKQQILHTFKNETISSSKKSMKFEDKQSEKSFTLNHNPHSIRLQDSDNGDSKSSSGDFSSSSSDDDSK